MMSATPLSPSPDTGNFVVPGQPLISFRDIRIGFEDGEVLRGVSFDVWPGETKVLLGVTGSGKTLLLKMAAGLLRPDAGSVVVMGNDLGDMPETELLDFRRRLGFVFQEGALFDSMNVAENVSFRLREERMDESNIESQVREALRFVELEETMEKFPSELSGGMRRRVSIARALVDHPALVLYDSPTAGLDPVTSQTIITLILRGRDAQGVTSVLATHRVQDAFGLANFKFDRSSGRVRRDADNRARAGGVAPETHAEVAGATNVVVLRDGKIYFEGPADDMLHTRDAYLKEFLASAE
ncbi:MAG: ABC transporter ATP-binding protein [Candidatus Acidiferrales bacterium]